MSDPIPPPVPTELPWYLKPDADPFRPMTIAEAADWLRLREFGFKDPVFTVTNWAARGRIPCTHLGRSVAFYLKLLRQHMERRSTLHEEEDAAPEGPAMSPATVPPRIEVFDEGRPRPGEPRTRLRLSKTQAQAEADAEGRPRPGQDIKLRLRHQKPPQKREDVGPVPGQS